MAKRIHSNKTVDNENKILKRENKKFVKGLVVVVIILLTIVIVSCIINIFDFFYRINEYAGYISLGICILLILLFVIKPIVIALATPCFTLDVLDYKKKKKVSNRNYRKLKRVAKNLINGTIISDQSKTQIKENINSRKNLNDVLKNIYDREIAKEINKIINDSASKVLLATAVSQNNRFDAATVALLNVRMIMKIVVTCGYHPSYPQLSKLIIKVFKNALVAYTIQTINLEELLVNGINRLVNGALNTIPLVSEITKSVTQGAANALLTLRTGILTRKYLYEEFDIQAMIDNPDSSNEDLLKEVVIEANSNIDVLIKDFKQKKKEKQPA